MYLWIFTHLFCFFLQFKFLLSFGYLFNKHAEKAKEKGEIFNETITVEKKQQTDI